MNTVSVATRRAAMRRRLALMGAIVLTGAVLAACGGSGGMPGMGAQEARKGSVPVEGGTYVTVNAAALAEMLPRKDFFLVNVHVPYAGEIEATDAFIPYDTIAQNLDQLPQDKGAKILLYCRSGRMSDSAARTLITLGYSNIWNLDGGMDDWTRAGYSLKNPPA